MTQRTDLGPLMVDLIARRAIAIPPAPEVALRLQELVASQRFDVGHLARTVGTEQSLMAAVLRAANSAAVRGVEPITVLSEAVSRLGTAELCRIAIASTLGEVASRDGVLAELRRLAWRRALTSAIVCKILADRLGMNAEELFTCGLLHDFGWVVGIFCLERLLASLPGEPERTAEEWLSLVSDFHVSLGTMVAASWRLSPLISAAMTFHHEPDRAGPHRRVMEVIAASDALVRLLEERTSISASDVRGVPGIHEPEFVAEIMPEIPALVANLLEAVPETASGLYSRVSKPKTMLNGTLKPLDLTGTWVHQGVSTPVKVIAMAADGLVVQLGKRPNENYLMKLHVDTPVGPLELCGNVMMSVTDAQEHHTEVRVFALGTRARESWNRVYSQN